MVLDETGQFKECVPIFTLGFTMIETTQSSLRELIVTEEAQVQCFLNHTRTLDKILSKNTQYSHACMSTHAKVGDLSYFTAATGEQSVKSMVNSNVRQSFNVSISQMSGKSTFTLASQVAPRRHTHTH